MIPVELSARAARRFRDEIAYLVRVGAFPTAGGLIERLDEARKLIAVTPELGRRTRRRGERRLPLAGTPYVLLYRLGGRRVVITAFLDGRARSGAP